jgi:ABC-type sugar transport system ATPase subunit
LKKLAFSGALFMNVLLQAQDITKSFGATQALRGVQLSLAAGKVHALVGENGAGKSTLFKICAGAIQKYGGRMYLHDRLYAPRDLNDAQRQGVALVFQEISINFALDIAENIFINHMQDFAGVFGMTRWRKMRRAAQAILDQIEAHISVTQRLSHLDLGQLKIIEIARALAHNPQVLLLDETTAFLNNQEMEALFRVINTLRGSGLAIGYISHHLDEIEQIADEITILKDGTWVGSYPMGVLRREEIEAKMVGREIGEQIYPKPSRPHGAQEPILCLENVSLPDKLHEVNLTLHSGEIVGIGGLKGSGGEALLSLIMGDAHGWRGTITYRGKPFRAHLPAQAWQQGIAYLPGDRTAEGLIVDFSVRENLSMALMPQRVGFVDYGKERRVVQDLIAQLQIKTASPAIACSSLSGGNLQKVVMGKCIAVAPQLLLLNNPTRGIDIGARSQIYSIIRQLAEQGLAVLLVTEDLAELIGMSDRIVVMRKGIISQTFQRGAQPISEEEVIRHMI